MAYTDNISRLSRLTAILLKLQAGPAVSVHSLANQFEVSTRTIYRDLQALERAGVPLVTTKGQGYQLLAGYTIPPVMFTEAEANALIMAEKMIEKTEDASLIEAFQAAADKVRAVLKKSQKEKISLLADRIIIGKNWNYSRSSAFLSEIQQALTNFNVLELDYRKADATESERRAVEPFAIYHNMDDHWVLIAWCRLRRDFRNFRLDRIEQLRRLMDTFEPHRLTLEEYVEIQRKKHFNEPLT